MFSAFGSVETVRLRSISFANPKVPRKVAYIRGQIAALVTSTPNAEDDDQAQGGKAQDKADAEEAEKEEEEEEEEEQESEESADDASDAELMGDDEKKQKAKDKADKAKAKAKAKASQNVAGGGGDGTAVRDTCNAYVVMSTEAEARAALGFNGQVIGGKHVRVDLAANSKVTPAPLALCLASAATLMVWVWDVLIAGAR